MNVTSHRITETGAPDPPAAAAAAGPVRRPRRTGAGLVRPGEDSPVSPERRMPGLEMESSSTFVIFVMPC